MVKNKKIFVVISLILFLILTLLGINSLKFKLFKHIYQKKAKLGIAVYKGGRIWAIGNDNKPLLSVFKYIVALKILEKLDKNGIPLNEELQIDKSFIDKALYSPMLHKYTSFPVKITIAELLYYMISESDNNACDILINYAGGIKAIDSYIHEIGFDNVRLYVNEKDMNKNIQNQYLNTARPVDIVKLLKSGFEGKLLSKNSTLYLNKIMLETTTGEDKLKAGLPKNVLIGHKTGSSSRKPDGRKIADNDVGFVILPTGEIYYIAVFVQDSARSEKENAELIRSISRIVYEHFTQKYDILNSLKSINPERIMQKWYQSEN